MKTPEIEALKVLLEESKKIVIIPHKNPDGDAIGSTLALKHYLTALNQEVAIISPNDYPEFLKWIPGQEEIINYESDKQKGDELIAAADLIFTLDFNHLGRCGALENPLRDANGTFVMIDHHQQPDDYAFFTYSDVSMSSTCQMVYHFIEKMGDLTKITPDIATCIYVGIMTDTGSFRFRSTTSTTHRVLATLIDFGADNTAIHEKIYDTNTYSRLQLQGIALQNLKVLPEYRTAYITISQEELDQHDFRKGDTEGFVNLGLSLNNIVFALIFIENKSEGIIKISLRSKGEFSVNEFSRLHFEGGGHHNAAGGKSNLSIKETVAKLISILPDYKNALNS
ncbi:bifunctional oligoribonuclease/PAP phosphatase NrnA [Aquimarina sp. W85]|uniref:DHH family phosphoesterase n=1 Tax=Aquimarina rhodophyticola TaxID=3342246 RepID=UPI00366E16DC